MANPTDFPARGKVVEARDGLIVFTPSDTNYRIHLMSPAREFAGVVGVPVQALLRVDARKVWTVPSGGNFVAPIFGPPKIIQGRVRYASDTHLVVQAGAPFVVALPTDDSGLDLANGPIALNTIVNVVAFPGAAFELLPQPAGSAR